MRVRSCAALAILMQTGTLGMAAAQSPDVRVRTGGDLWVIPVGDAESLLNEFSNLEAQIETAGRTPIVGETAIRQFEEKVTLPAPEIAQDDIDEWVRRSREAVRRIARAEYELAREQLLAAQSLSARAAEELNREVERARTMIDTCLFMVRAYYETDQIPEAERQARECRRLVPSTEPTEFRHPPEIRELLAKVDEQMASEPAARLQVTSEPSGCVVRVNGIEFGQTPYLVDHLRPGDYRLQVECTPEERGRVRRIRLEAGETSIAVDAAFDAAFESRPVLRMKTAALQHAATLARSVAAELLIIRRDGDRFALVRMGVGGPVAEARVSSGTGVPAALTDLLAGRSMDYTVTPPAPMGADVEAPAPRYATQPLSTTRLALGLSAGALAIGAFAGAAFAHVRRGQWGEIYLQAQPTDIDFLDRQTTWDGLGLPVAATALTGMALGAVAFGLLAPEAEGVPWWAWVGGAVGVALIAGAIVAGIVGDTCDEVAVTRQACVDRGQGAGRAWLLGSAGGALLSWPMAYLFGRDPSGSLIEEDSGSDEGASHQVPVRMVVGPTGVRGTF